MLICQRFYLTKRLRRVYNTQVESKKVRKDLWRTERCNMDRFENFTVMVLKINKLVHKIKLVEMDGYGLKAIHVMCIYYAGAAPVTAGELSRLTCEDKAAISRALTMFKKRGFITYDAGRYNAEVTLTEEGKKLYDYINVKSKAAVDAAGADLSETERAALYKSLASIAENLEKYYNSITSG